MMQLPHESVQEAVADYNGTLYRILDKHAPVVNKTVTVRPDTSWYTEKIRQQKLSRRQTEQIWRKSGL